MRSVLNKAAFVLTGFALWLAGFSATAAASTFVLPSDDDLIIGARAIVRARVLAVASAPDENSHRIFTYVTLRVQEVIKGQISDRRIVLKEMGGQLASRGQIIFGAPRYRPNERVLVYLDTWADGSLRTHQMLLGKFTIIEDEAAGQSFAARELDDANIIALDSIHSHAPRGPVTNRCELGAYTRMVRERLLLNQERAESFEQAHYSNVAMLAAPPEYARASERGLQPQFHFITIPPVRWFEPDEGQPVVFTVNIDGAPNPEILQDVTAAMDAWSAVAGCNLRVANGGATGACYEHGGENTIVFNNCDGRFAPTPGCASVLALGGLSWDSSQQRVVNGVTFYRGRLGHISFNPYAACAFENHCDVREITTHELGHALGLGHSQYPEATMFSVAHFDGRCASLKPDDIDGIKFIYPLTEAPGGPLTITTASQMPNGVLGATYPPIVLSATGGTPPYAWSLIAPQGRLPLGMTFSSLGVISGIPTETGSFSFTVKVTDFLGGTAEKRLSITIGTSANEFDAQFLSQSVPSTVSPGQIFSVNLRWLNAGSRAWSGSSGLRLRSQNPSGNIAWGGDTVPLSFHSVAAGQQLDITFTAFAPRTPGAYNFQWQLFQDGPGLFGQMSDNISVVVSGAGAVSINGPSSVEAAQGAQFSLQLAASGGTSPYAWSVASGLLPTGITLNPASGAISGTPTVAGASAFTVQVRDSQSQMAQKAITITVLLPALEVLTASAPPGQVSIPFSLHLAAAGGRQPYTWSIATGSLPPGLSLAPSIGMLSGTPVVAGDYTFTLEVSDMESRRARKTLSMRIAPAPLSIGTATRFDVMMGEPFSYQPAARGGTPPYSWGVVSGALPPGLAINPQSGAISGTPTVSGTFNLELALRDSTTVSAVAAIQIKVIDPQSVPAIRKVKYKLKKGKLTVNGARVHQSAVLMIDGVAQVARARDGQFIIKKLTLTPGRHEIRIINPDNISSEPYVLDVN
jgi:hypothetical protein